MKDRKTLKSAEMLHGAHLSLPVQGFQRGRKLKLCLNSEAQHVCLFFLFTPLTTAAANSLWQ